MADTKTTTTTAADEETEFIVQQSQPLSNSLIWTLQRNFYSQEGIEAWGQGTVPHYITCNPFIAQSYAHTVFAFLQDCSKAGKSTDNGHGFAPLDLSQPFYIFELGAGSGRFSYLFLKQFFDLYKRSALNNISVTYVMTDFAEKNINFWKAHPSFYPFLDEGFLDFAHFDVEHHHELRLINSNQNLTADTVKNPVVVLANYFFDTVPLDAFFVKDGELFENLVTLRSAQDEQDISDPDIISRVKLYYEHRPISNDGYYGDEDFDSLLKRYQERLSNTNLRFPTVALRCCRFFQDISNGRMLLLAGDKGDVREEELVGQGPVGLAVHGSFSMKVNFHAIGEYFQRYGGQVLHTSHKHVSLAVVAFLLGNHPDNFQATCHAYSDAVEKFGPDDFFVLKKNIEANCKTMDLPEIMALLRLSRWDVRLVRHCLSRLMKLVDSSSNLQKQELFRALERSWSFYFHIGEGQDFPFGVGLLLYEMQYYPEALIYFQRSLDLYGADQATYLNMALSHYYMHQLERSLDFTNMILTLNPAHDSARAMRIQIRSEAARRRSVA